MPGAWTRITIEARGTLGATATGGVALWIDVGTEAHFRNLTVTSAGERPPER